MCAEYDFDVEIDEDKSKGTKICRGQPSKISILGLIKVTFRSSTEHLFNSLSTETNVEYCICRRSTDGSKFDSEEVGVNQLNDSSDASKSYLLEGAAQDDDTDKRNKTYYRAKQLCSILKKKGEKIFKEFTLKYKKHYYTLQDGTYYQFPTTKEIIIDADVILKSKNKIYKNLLINSMKSVKRELGSNRGIEKTSIIVILGHFNHGKTTLLDALGNFTIVEKEVHGITQVIILLIVNS